MKKEIPSRIHALLDGVPDEAGADPAEKDALLRYRAALVRLQQARVCAPPGMTAAIMAGVKAPARPSFLDRLRNLVPARQAWPLPAFAGALATLLLVLGIQSLRAPDTPDAIRVHFQLHAPGANRVELVGNFNNWAPGVISLQGPDASGHWTADIDLPQGRYDYQFLVDGRTWVTDPQAPVHRPDGFGRENAVIDVIDERSDS